MKVLVAQSLLCLCALHSKEVIGCEPPVYGDVWEHRIGDAEGTQRLLSLEDSPIYDEKQCSLVGGSS